MSLTLPDTLCLTWRGLVKFAHSSTTLVQVIEHYTETCICVIGIPDTSNKESRQNVEHKIANNNNNNKSTLCTLNNNWDGQRARR